MLRVPNVTKVNLYGAQDEKIFVEFSHAKLATLGVSTSAIFDSLQRQNVVVPAGTIDTGAARVALRVSGALDGAKAVAETPVEAGGRTFRLGDIATVTRGFKDPPTYHHPPARQAGGGWSASSCRRAATSPQLGDELAKAVASSAGSCRSASTRADRRPAAGRRTGRRRIQDLVHRGARHRAARQLLSLGLRTGIIVALSVPLVLAIVFIVMYAIGSICTASRSARSSSRSACWWMTPSSRSR
jgi:multidrug efflux pump